MFHVLVFKNSKPKVASKIAGLSNYVKITIALGEESKDFQLTLLCFLESQFAHVFLRGKLSSS